MGRWTAVRASRLLRDMGLFQGPQKDFTVDSNTQNPDTLEWYTTIHLHSTYARRLVADYADYITNTARAAHYNLNVSYDLSDPANPTAQVDDLSTHVAFGVPSPDPDHQPVRVRYQPESVRTITAPGHRHALYIPDPIHNTLPEYTLTQLGKPGYEGVEVIGHAYRVTKRGGSPRPGWIVSSRDGQTDILPDKATAFQALEQVILTHFTHHPDPIEAQEGQACQSTTADPVWPGAGTVEMGCARPVHTTGRHRNDTIEGDPVEWDDDGNVWFLGKQI